MWDQFKLSLPFLGTVLQKAEVAGLTRTLGTLLHNGVPILQAMEIVKETVDNRVFSLAIDEARQKLKGGVGIGDALKQIRVFPSLATQMTIVGDETGRLDAMLLTVADTYDQQVRTSIKRLTSLLEPIMILGMALIVGGIVISMLVGIFSINDLPI
jgi:general secretion pathway protein F